MKKADKWEPVPSYAVNKRKRQKERRTAGEERTSKSGKDY